MSSSRTGVEPTSGGVHAKGKTPNQTLTVKQRTLRERPSDPAGPRRVCRDLTQEFNAETPRARSTDQHPVDAHKMDDLAGAAPHRPHAAVTSAPAAHAAAIAAPAAPPEAEASDFWTCMEQMTTKQSNAIPQDINIVATQLDNNITTGLQTLEMKSTTDLRRLETATTKNTDGITMLTKRMDKPETRPSTSAADSPEAPPRHNGWIQNTVILGGWPETVDGAKAVQAARHAIAAAGTQVSDNCLDPFNPRGSKFAKLQFASELLARQGMFTLAKTTQRLQTSSPEYKGVWISPERPPDQASRRRVLLNAADSIRSLLPADSDATGRPDHPSGTIMYNRLPVLDIAADGFLTTTSLWSTIPALADKTWTKVNTSRRD